MAATESNVKVATHATEPPATSNCDPFVDNTKPRHDCGNLAALMAAIQQVSKCLLALHLPLPDIFPVYLRDHRLQSTTFSPWISSTPSPPSPRPLCVHCSHVRRLFQLHPLHRHRHRLGWLEDPKLSPIALYHAADNALTSP
jgi:hypothetical protein